MTVMRQRGRWLSRLTGLVAGLVCLAVIIGVSTVLLAQEDEPQEVDHLDRLVYLPTEWAERVVYYQSFRGDPTEPEMASDGMRATVRDGRSSDGLNEGGMAFRGRGGSSSAVEVSLARRLSAGPLTVMAWFRLDEAMTPSTGFSLVTLRGPKGHIAGLVKGRGRWRALKRPTFVYRVWGFEGIVNDVPFGGGGVSYEKGTWHHVAITVAAGSEVTVYLDGKVRTRYGLKGRRLRAGDLTHVELGPAMADHPMTLDEIVVLDRALSEAEVRDVIESTRKLSDHGFPVLSGE